MSPLAEKSALWAAQNRLRGVRDRTETLSPTKLVQAGISDDDEDELSGDIMVLGQEVEDDRVYTTDTNLIDIYKDGAGVWHFTLIPFVIPPFILPTLPAGDPDAGGWIGTLATGDSQAAPIEEVTGKALTLWLNVSGSIERVFIDATPYYDSTNGDFTISGASLSWQLASFTPPAPPAIPGSTIQTVPFDWWIAIMTPNTSVATDHADYNKPVGNSDFAVNNGGREFYPPYLYS